MRLGDRCEQCRAGWMKAYSTRTTGARRTRYLRCSNCDHRGKEAIQVDALGREVVATHSNKTVLCPHCNAYHSIIE